MGGFDRFDAEFAALTGFAPLRWQRRLFEDYFLIGNVPAALDLPTGLGKTSVMAVWYLAQKAGAPVPRRLVYVVDRRAVVDQATTVADRIKEDSGDRTLRVSTLRGQHADNKAWLEDPAAPALIVGTVDMIGSRLLFSGYGVSRRMRPYQAGLLGADTLLVLDESHLVPAFERLLEQVTKQQHGPLGGPAGTAVPGFRLLSLSATGTDQGARTFRLDDDDRERDEIVAMRLKATKRLSFVPLGGGALWERLAREAWALAGDGTQGVRVLVYCNSRDVADRTKSEIEKLAGKARAETATELFVGARRVREREHARMRLQELGFLSGDAAPGTPVFVIATSAGEVGVDLDADHMVMDVVPFERMVQRLGRVNRLGEKDATIVAVHEHETVPEPKKAGAPTDEERRAVIAWKAFAVLQELPCHADGSHDASPGAVSDLRRDRKGEVDAATTPVPLYPALTRPLVDAWSMTSLEVHTGRPEVAPWLRGWVEDEQVTLVWRTHLPVRTTGGEATDREIDAFFEAAPPHLTERLETEVRRVVKWLMARAARLAAIAAKDGDGSEATAARPPLGEQSIVALALDPAGRIRERFRLADLQSGDDATRRAESLGRMLQGATLVVDVRLGGLGAAGLLDEAVDGAVAADGDVAWPEVGFRVESVPAETEAGGRRERTKPFYFALERNGEGEDVHLLVVEKTRGESRSEEDRALSLQPQLLAEHQGWAAAKARALAAALGLGADLAAALETAARLHDEGKRARRWQRAFNAPAGGIYAKTKGPVKSGLLCGYRHEFGSLFHAAKDAAFGELPPDMQDLVLHLIAAHHGHARPTIATEGCEEAPPSLLEAQARDVALRFARLNARWGPWGLAWLEALLRAADQQASRDNDTRGATDGRR